MDNKIEIKLGLAMPTDRFVSVRSMLSLMEFINFCDLTKGEDSSWDSYIDLEYRINDAKPIDHSRNKMAEQLLISGCEWILFVDSDQIFSFNTIAYMLKHIKEHKELTGEDIKIIGPMNFQGRYPHRLAARGLKDGKLMMLDDTDLTPNEIGLQEVAMIGTGVILIHRDVFQTIKDKGLAPNNRFFQFRFDEQTSSLYGEDVVFCEKARDCGFKLYLDTKVVDVKHVTPDGIGIDAHELYKIKRKELNNINIDLLKETVSNRFKTKIQEIEDDTFKSLHNGDSESIDNNQEKSIGDNKDV